MPLVRACRLIRVACIRRNGFEAVVWSVLRVFGNRGSLPGSHAFSFELDRQSKVIVVHHPKLVLAYCHVLASRLRRIISSSFLESLRTDPAWFFFHILLRLAPRRFYCFPLTTRLLPPSFLSSYASSAVYYFAISYKPPISVLPELSSPYHPRLLLCSLCHIFQHTLFHEPYQQLPSPLHWQDGVPCRIFLTAMGRI